MLPRGTLCYTAGVDNPLLTMRLNMIGGNTYSDEPYVLAEFTYVETDPAFMAIYAYEADHAFSLEIDYTWFGYPAEYRDYTISLYTKEDLIITSDPEQTLEN